MSTNLASHLEPNHDKTFRSSRPPEGSSITIDSSRRTTFRISKIPVTVLKEDLLSILGTLFPPTSFHRQVTTPGRVLECSVAPSPMESGRYQVATVTFDSIPTQLQSCGGTKEWVSLTAKFGSTTMKLVFDSHFIGLTPLQDGISDSYQFDLFFVTGLAGHAFGSWKARGEHTMWVRDFLAKDLEYKHPGKVRVLTYGYDTKLLESSSTAGVAEFACSLLDAVKNARRSSEEQRRPIIFVAHSLGGLVVKKALLQAAAGTERDLDVSRSAHACFFLGVPHRDLESGSPFLEDLERSFKETFTLDSLRIFSVYETRLSATVQQSASGIWNRTGPMVEMVTKESALDWLAKDKRHTRIPRNVDHSTLAKFTSNADHDYESLRCHILECVEDASKIVSKNNGIFVHYPYERIRAFQELDTPNWLLTRLGTKVNFLHVPFSGRGPVHIRSFWHKALKKTRRRSTAY
ncbi:hypothetical protein DFP73DRAFT_554359 [Morchella snyderi]|nr:hypothetical protein DFP73DRAFT_554359 [Morchella snyderi]